MQFIVRSRDGSERVIEASSCKRDESRNRFVFSSPEQPEDQFIPVDEVTTLLHKIAEPQPHDTYDRYKDRLNRLDAHIRFEYQLTAQRLTYLAMSETFLFATYSAALAHHSGDGAHPALKTMVHVIPWMGIIVALVLLLTGIGTIRVNIRLKREREELDSLAQGFQFHQWLGSGSFEHWVGVLPPLVLPVAFFVAWILIWPG